MKLEERPSFFKALVGDFSQQLRIPRAFVKNFNGHVPRFCGLRGPCGKMWAVSLKVVENRLVIHDGWQSFVETHNLEVGDFLIFTLDGVSTFDVIIYGKSYCEKIVGASKNRIANVVDRTIKTDIILGKRLAPDLVEETSIRPISSDSSNPYFRTTFTKSMRYDLRIPSKVVRAAGLMSDQTIMLQDPAGSPWFVKLHDAKRGRMRMEGWCKCCEANQISVGDNLPIEIVKHSVFQLYVYKGSEALDVNAQS
ncbi:LOW QUALITY PROTEIN: B3 domain-containing protein REM5-like [Argentina anserina]|uniref:LOW QUALITY PROTEIN: B3 domain-containing protein REM5-like n=1 Tax=Argentina anserina TaxID=57926 RepID=UPI00217645D5|nr:LOW QUALITY PROTEIN: B3 domain-containing protein REM5-like [Potentilla anserina]